MSVYPMHLTPLGVVMSSSATVVSMFPPASFDGVVMADVLEHLLDLPSAMKQARPAHALALALALALTTSPRPLLGLGLDLGLGLGLGLDLDLNLDPDPDPDLDLDSALTLPSDPYSDPDPDPDPGSDPPLDPGQVQRVLRPGGVLVFDTINRSYQSYLLTIVLAQAAPLTCSLQPATVRTVGGRW